GCCAQAVDVISNKPSASLRSISLSFVECLVFCHKYHNWSMSCSGRSVENATRTKAAPRMFLVRGLGLRSANLLIKHFKQPERVFDSTHDELEALGVPPEVADDVLSPKSQERAEEEWERGQKL